MAAGKSCPGCGSWLAVQAHECGFCGAAQVVFAAPSSSSARPGVSAGELAAAGPQLVAGFVRGYRKSLRARAGRLAAEGEALSRAAWDPAASSAYSSSSGGAPPRLTFVDADGSRRMTQTGWLVF